MKPLLFFDIETTGVNVATDRIIDLAAYVETKIADRFENGSCRTNPSISFRFNPGIPIPPEATAIHGITNDKVADEPLFAQWAHKIHEFFLGHDLAGYNIANFDVPLLWEEFRRAGIDWDLSDVNIIDVCAIYRIKEARTLTHAAMFYCNAIHKAHAALDDVMMARRVYRAQRFKYDDLSELDNAGIAKFCGTADRVDIAGKIIRNAKGVPCYSFGKSKDIPVTQDRGFGEWMLRSDFSEQTKGVVRRLLNGRIS